MRQLRIRRPPLRLLLALALPPALLLAARGGAAPRDVPEAPAEEPSPPPASDCSFVPSHDSPRELWRRVSERTERVALGAPAAGGALVPTRRFTNLVDVEVFAKMTRDGVRPAPAASEPELLRRFYLDLTGQAPSADVVKAYLSDKTPDKRDRMISQLLADDTFAERFTLWFGDLVQNVMNNTNGIALRSQGRNAYAAFIYDSISTRKPYDQMVRELIAGTGNSYAAGPPNFWVRQVQGNGPIQDTYDNLSAFTAEKFLGVQATCLSCHGGPGHTDAINLYLSTKTRADFWRNAAFFSRAQQKGATEGGQNVTDNSTGSYRLNTTSGNKTPRQPDPGQPGSVEPAFLLTGETPRAGETWRQAYARMLTAHPQFARNTVNQIWKELFGLGLVEPEDGFDLMRLDPSTPPLAGWSLQPTHPRLLARLADAFVASGYDLRWLVRTIVTSQTYQLSMRYDGDWSETFVPYFARRYPRRLMAEQLVDSLCQATAVPPNVSMPGVTNTMTATTGSAGVTQTVPRAFWLPDTAEGGGWATLLNTFGRGNRDTAPRTNDAATTQALSMLNDSLVWRRVQAIQAGSTVQRTLAATRDPKAVTDALYLATLARYPTPAEAQKSVDFLKSGDLTARTEDLQFALLNTLEFLHY